MAKTDEATTSEQTADTEDESTKDETSTQNDASADDKGSEEHGSDKHGSDDGGSDSDEAADDEEPVSEPVDQSPALRDGGTLNLGICHFGGASEPASRLATRSDGTGWIAVCEEHTKDAEDAGFVLEKDASS